MNGQHHFDLKELNDRHLFGQSSKVGLEPAIDLLQILVQFSLLALRSTRCDQQLVTIRTDLQICISGDLEHFKNRFVNHQSQAIAVFDQCFFHSGFLYLSCTQSVYQFWAWDKFFSTRFVQKGLRTEVAGKTILRGKPSSRVSKNASQQGLAHGLDRFDGDEVFVQKRSTERNDGGGVLFRIGDTHLHRCFRRGRSPDFLDGCSESTLRYRNPSLAAVRLSAQRGRPLGDPDWIESIASRLNLESTIRPRGRQQIRVPQPPIKKA
jgi:hypothetical protein